MRISPARYALVVFSVLALAGCKSGESTMYSPSATLSKLNPFSSSRDKADYPVKPSALASATPASAADVGYANVNSPASPPGRASSVPAGAYPNSQYTYPTASSRALPGSRPTGSPATTPQTGPYGSQASQTAVPSASSPPAGSRYSWNTGTASPAAAGHGSATPDYREASLSGAYGQPASAAPRYSVPSDRYGSNAVLGAKPPSQPSAPADPYASVRDHNSQYTNPAQGLSDSSNATTKSSYASPADSRYADFSSPPGTSAPADRYNASAAPSEQDRYARADSSPYKAYSGYRNSQPADSQGDTNWNPGAPTDNAPGSSNYQPGNTGYQPGNTGYNPPGVSPYGSPSASYTPPSATTNSTTPFLPGSTQLYEPRSANTSGTLGAPPSAALPTTDFHVVPAGNTRLAPPAQSYLR
ncbi:MAG: hypothetical protein HQ582_07530 [Planctomycetes bacterium]|nr:hypothetical protein [Planctomycetota bacterium]